MIFSNMVEWACRYDLPPPPPPPFPSLSGLNLVGGTTTLLMKKRLWPRLYTSNFAPGEIGSNLPKMRLSRSPSFLHNREIWSRTSIGDMYFCCVPSLNSSSSSLWISSNSSLCEPSSSNSAAWCVLDAFLLAWVEATVFASTSVPILDL